MLHHPVQSLTGSKALLLAAMVLVPAHAPVLAAATTAPRLHAGQRLPSFEVASIKPNRSADMKSGIQTQPGGRFTATHVTLRELIRYAYQLHDFQIGGGPGWLGSDRFDVVAKADDGGANPFESDKGGGPSRGQVMLRALLADRFKLEAHTESRELPIYALTLSRNDGPQLRRSSRDCGAAGSDGRAQSGKPPALAEAPPCEMRVYPGTILAGGTTLAQLAEALSSEVGRIVRDRTGLTARFEFTLRWTPDQIPQGFDRKAAAIGLPAIDADGPSLFTAMREQLGLKVDSSRGPVDVLVIDRAERPTDN
jgi:bla regulator protein blaR1